jgi:tRNA (guanine10-N2)-methyltransferase
VVVSSHYLSMFLHCTGHCLLQLADGQRELITKLSLKRRKFIGNTSMDPQLSLYMANQSLVQPGDIVLDPFVGTGKLRF